MKNTEIKLNQFKSSIFYFISALLFYLLFKKKFEDYFIQKIVDKYFKYITTSWGTDILFIICLFIGILYVFSKNRILFFPPRWLLVFVNVIYFYYRFCGETGYLYFSIFKLDIIYYLDIIPAISTVYFISLILNKKSEIQKEKNNYLEIFTDDPSQEDRYGGRKQLAEVLVGRILATKNQTTSIGIGITGRWGEGKTSFLNFFKTGIGNKAEIFEFRPWLFNEKKQLEIDFFREFKIFLEKCGVRTSLELDEYISHLTSTEIDWFTKILSLIKNIILPPKLIDEIKASLSNKIQKHAKKIIIIIDDLDRLDKNEIIEVLKIIRSSANFPNLFFIVTYDKNYILKQLNEDSNNSDSNEYLNKFFQIEIPLPVFESYKIFESIYSKLEKIIDKDLLINSKEFLNSKLFLIHFKNERDILRYINNISTTLSVISINEMELEDFLSIEVFKLKCLELYNELWKEKWITHLEIRFGDQYEIIEEREVSSVIEEKFKMIDKKGEFFELFSHMRDSKKFKKSYGIAPFKNENKIAKASKHDRYFAQRLFEDDISIVEFENNIEKLNEDELLKYFLGFKEKRRENLISILDNYNNFDNKEICFKYYKAIYRFFKNEPDYRLFSLVNFFFFDHKDSFRNIISQEEFEKEYTKLLESNLYNGINDGYVLTEFIYYSYKNNKFQYFTESLAGNIRKKIFEIINENINSKNVTQNLIHITLCLEDIELLKRLISECLHNFLTVSLDFYEPRGYSFYQWNWHNVIFKKQEEKFALFLISECKKQDKEIVINFLKKYDEFSEKNNSVVHIQYNFQEFLNPKN